MCVSGFIKAETKIGNTYVVRKVGGINILGATYKVYVTRYTYSYYIERDYENMCNIESDVRRVTARLT